MNLALNNAMNVVEYYKEAGENVKIEVVTFGPGLHMLREDTSPVKARIETMSLFEVSIYVPFSSVRIFNPLFFLMSRNS